ncbi:unnamed protein product [Tuber melanosporum]|uniref:(Perigord truffle) hypothetical protein n=1 Tax=Tuber melanosporum (strain Mel28) TaxID=656061 RepID=D5GE22_TUBMM|nr:uncharacterized protein GSTUM_00001195001 [Tuber melanosporum]CAZ82765.1 unnamed protein product [Tuber melanosporum]
MIYTLTITSTSPPHHQLTTLDPNINEIANILEHRCLARRPRVYIDIWTPPHQQPLPTAHKRLQRGGRVSSRAPRIGYYVDTCCFIGLERGKLISIFHNFCVIRRVV